MPITDSSERECLELAQRKRANVDALPVVKKDGTSCGSIVSLASAEKQNSTNQLSVAARALGDAATFAAFIDQYDLPVEESPVATGSDLTSDASTLTQYVQLSEDAWVPHSTVLVDKWMTSAQLNKIRREQGLLCKQGKFSKEEDQLLSEAMERYRIEKGHSSVDEVIFNRNKDHKFWSIITAAVPYRPIQSVYKHVRRTRHPLRNQGQWQEEEDKSLTEAVEEFGQSWERVSLRVGRMAADCRDRFINHIANRNIRKTGKWSQKEQDDLKNIVVQMIAEHPNGQVSWDRVSQLMGNTRGRHQCREKWNDSLSRTVRYSGKPPTWSARDEYTLFHKIDALGVHSDDDINWKQLSDPNWNAWSGRNLQKKWKIMKNRAIDSPLENHQEIMSTLRARYAKMPISKKNRKRAARAATADLLIPFDGISTEAAFATEAP